jgi:hypothetical protein
MKIYGWFIKKLLIVYIMIGNIKSYYLRNDVNAYSFAGGQMIKIFDKWLI